MWKYQKELEEIFRDYVPDGSPYSLRIVISSTALAASQGPDYDKLTFENGVYKLKHRSIDMRCEQIGETDYTSEEEAIYYWLGSFSVIFSEDSEIRKRVGELRERLSAIFQKKT